MAQQMEKHGRDGCHPDEAEDLGSPVHRRSCSTKHQAVNRYRQCGNAAKQENHVHSSFRDTIIKRLLDAAVASISSLINISRHCMGAIDYTAPARLFIICRSEYCNLLLIL